MSDRLSEIPLTKGLVAIVDAEDYERVMAVGSWHAKPDDHRTYAEHSIKRGGRVISVKLHHFLTGLPLVDHINGDGLDNRKANLRQATTAENSRNARLRRDSTSGFKGVSWHKACGKWRAQITVNRRAIYLGHHTDVEAAARAYDAAAREHFGEFAWLNFPASPSGRSAA